MAGDERFDSWTDFQDVKNARRTEYQSRLRAAEDDRDHYAENPVLAVLEQRAVGKVASERNSLQSPVGTNVTLDEIMNRVRRQQAEEENAKAGAFMEYTKGEYPALTDSERKWVADQTSRRQAAANKIVRIYERDGAAIAKLESPKSIIYAG